MVYNKNNISLFNHEHLIYVSDYFIKKLSQSKHWYIDGTFVYQKGFSQLIVILYYDKILNKRFPGIFGLINDKKESGYEYLFKTIKSILTIDNTKNLNLKSFTIDFETALINATKKNI